MMSDARYTEEFHRVVEGMSQLLITATVRELDDEDEDEANAILIRARKFLEENGT